MSSSFPLWAEKDEPHKEASKSITQEKHRIVKTDTTKRRKNSNTHKKKTTFNSFR